MAKSIERLPLLCRRRNHRHDDLIGELMAEHGCQSDGELRSLLMAALQWADRCGLCIEEVLGDVGPLDWPRGGVGMGYTVQLGRKTFEYATDCESWNCPTYQRLLKAALALCIMLHPTARGEVESNSGKLALN